MKWLEKAKQLLAANKMAELKTLVDDSEEQFRQSRFTTLTQKREPIEYTWPAMNLPEIVSVREIAARNMARWGTPAPSLAQDNQEQFDSLRAINRRNREFYGA